ncbi:MAG: methyltransferase, TIGR04325 family [Pararhodobacter sp.]
MSAKAKAKAMLGTLGHVAAKRHLIQRRRDLTGAYPDFATALANVPRGALSGYDHDEAVGVKLHEMAEILEWDYPVIYWLGRILAEHEGPLRLLDSGGHVGTKFMAFRRLLDLSRVDWAVHDLAPMVRAGRTMASELGLGPNLSFVTSVPEAGARDLLLCSGLLQYLDRPLAQLLAEMPSPPQHIVINKVALREGPGVVTLQRAGPCYLPYQIRNRREFENELDALGYILLDRWEIPSLSHRIDSHPELGSTTSTGYVLCAPGFEPQALTGQREARPEKGLGRVEFR